MESQSDNYKGPERRRYPRLSGNFVEYSRIGDDVAKKTSFTENISPVGICFLTDEKIKPNTYLSLKIYLPDSKDTIETKGKVIWSKISSFLSVGQKKHYDLGVELVEIDEDDQQKIWEYIASHSA